MIVNLASEQAEDQKAPSNQEVHEYLKKVMTDDGRCYILITSGAPKEGGELDVEMTYGGDDPWLVSFLLENAQQHLDQHLMQHDEEE